MLEYSENDEANEGSRTNSGTDTAQEDDDDNPTTSSRKKTYLQEQLDLACEAVKNGIVPFQACKTYKVPRSTLQYRVKNKIFNQPGVRTGPKCYLSREEEMPMVDRLCGLADAGFNISGKLVRTFAVEYVKANQAQIATKDLFLFRMPSQEWSRRLFKQHPQLEQRNWAGYGNEPVATWFTRATRYLENVDGMSVLQNRLQIFTVDDVRLETNKFRYPVSTFCLFGANAYGNLLPPLVLYPREKKLPTTKEQSTLKYSVAHQDTEETAGNALFQWLSKVFQPWLVEQNVPRPVILFIDGHRLRMGYRSSEFCKQHQILFVSLLSRSDHEKRPLHNKLFGPMKKLWHEEVPKAPKNKSVLSFVDYLLNSILNQLSDVENNIREGFYRSQIYPWNRNGYSVPLTTLAPSAPKKRKITKTRPQKSVAKKPKTTKPPPPPRKPADSKLTRYRKMFESRLPVHQLARFQDQRHCVSWQGPVEETCLFQVWRDLQNEIEGTYSLQETINGTESSDVKQEDEGLYIEPEMVTVKQEDSNDLTLDFVKEEPSVGDEELCSDC